MKDLLADGRAVPEPAVQRVQQLLARCREGDEQDEHDADDGYVEVVLMGASSPRAGLPSWSGCPAWLMLCLASRIAATARVLGSLESPFLAASPPASRSPR